MRKTHSLVMTVLILILISSGCGRTDPNKGAVSGSVTLDGEPLDHAQIVFRDPQGQQASAGGKIVKGEYELETPVAAMRVEITAYREIPGKFDNSNPTGPVPLAEQVLPARYNRASELTADVKAGANEFNFQLKSDK